MNAVQNATYSDQLTLQAVANLYLVELVIISSLGLEARTVISPQNHEPMAQFLLAHFAKDQGIHSVCLATDNENDQYDEEENEFQETVKEIPSENELL